MKKGIITVIVIAVVLVIGWAVLGGNSSDVQNTGNDDVTREGVITSVNAEQAALDGPILVTIDSDEGEEVIAIPTMGIQLCAARENIADGFELEAGEFVDVRGSRDSSGQIVPCESSDHYLRVSSVQGE